MEKSTKDLINILKSTHPEDVNNNLNEIKDELIREDFYTYMRDRLKEKNLLQQTVFIRADISEKYGYKLLRLEKHTTQRDVILRICYAAEFNVEETNKALLLYGMPALYPRIKRDAILINGFANRPGDILDLNEFLKTNGEIPLKSSGNIDWFPPKGGNIAIFFYLLCSWYKIYLINERRYIMKRNKLLLVSGILGTAYLAYIIIYFLTNAVNSSDSLVQVGSALAFVLLTPHMIFVGIALFFNWLAFLLKARWSALLAGIIYCISMLLFVSFFWGVIAEMVLCIVAFAQMKKVKPNQEL